MSDVQIVADTREMLLQLMLRAAPSCELWAHLDTDGADWLLWPKSRGPAVPEGTEYAVDLTVAQRGIWRVALASQDALPKGIDQACRDALICARIISDVQCLKFRQADQIIQVGLFGEVLF